MALIPILGVPSTFRVPGQFAEIVFAQGPSSAAAAAREVILVMPLWPGATPAPVWTVNTVYRVRNEQDLIDGAGAGSPLHRAGRVFLQSNRTAKLWALPYSPSSGMGVATADETVTWATDPTGTGVTTLTVCGEPNSVGFDSSDTVTTIATDMVGVINSKVHLPVVATNAMGVLTLTAKISGESQGDGTTGVIRLRAEIDSGVGTTVVAAAGALGLAGTAGVDGATTESANLTTALSAIDAARYYFMGFSVWDATPVGAAVTHISAKSEPLPGLRSVGVAGFTGSLSLAQTLATGRNYERLQLVWQPNSEHDTAHLVGNMLGIRQKYEEKDSATNFDSYRRSGDWLILPAFSQGDWPDTTDQNDAINDGVAPIASDGSGSKLVMSTTTRSKNAAGTVDDFRVTETHRVSVADEYTDTLLLRHALNYENKKLKGDQLLSDGTVDNNQRLFPNVVTPHQYKPFVKRLLQEFEDAAKIQNAQTSKDGLRVVRDPQNGGRLEVGHDLHVIDLLHQTTFRLAEVSTG